MIRIKDYIFNENDIRRIYYNKDKSCLCIGFRDEDLVTNWVENANFSDIEWNYGNNISESLSYDLAKARIEELEEENEKSKNDIKLLLKENGNKERVIKKQEEILNKAIEYIEKLFILEDDNVTYEFKNDEIKPLLKILKGEEND
jgi:protoporphyrinogen oxidase